MKRFAIFLVLLLAGIAAMAQSAYPARPVRIVVSYPAGGTNDFVARTVAQHLSELLGQQFVVENRAGAGGNIGAEVVAKAAPDGYTLFMAAGAHALAPSLYRKLGYDLVNDFVPISLAAQSAFVLAVNPALPVTNARELIQYAKNQPGGISYAVTGMGVPTHLAGEMFKSLAGIKMTPIPYKGDTPALVDLLSGQVGVSFVSVAPALPHFRAQKLRPLAVSTRKRSAILPDLPTVAEATGFADFDVSTWFGLLAPAGTPADVVKLLEANMVKILAMPEVKEKFAAQGMEAVGTSSAEFSTYIREEIQKFSRMVKAANVQPE